MSLEIGATEETSSKVNDGSLGRGQKGILLPRSLIISPNLDALLEHEERKRAQNASGAEPRSPESYYGQQQSPQSLSPSTEFPIGLPPPPRRPRGSKLPLSPLTEVARRSSMVSTDTTEEDTSQMTPPLSSSMSNPYINPAPTLDDVLQTVKVQQKQRSRHGSSSSVTALPSRQRSPSFPNPKLDHSATEKIEEHAAYSSNLFRARSKGKLVKQRQKENLTGRSFPDMRQVALSNVVDDQNQGRNDTRQSWRRRPLISHAHHSSVSSSESNNTSSTHGPPSTIEHEPRISISSTVYQASSAHSHPQSLYNEPAFDMATQYRNSFMEIYSPTNPEFNPGRNSPDGNGHAPISPLQFPGSPVSGVSLIDKRSISPKPPIPTAPKPMFTRPALRSRQSSPRESPTSSMHNEQKAKGTPLPPTTNFLDVDERADLVRKSRKLARVFGQTPGADAMAQQDTGNTYLSTKPRRRDVGSTSDDLQRPHSSLHPHPESLNLSSQRRHSMPPTPDDISFLSIVSPTPSRGDFQIRPTSSDLPNHHSRGKGQNRSSSTTSFIDLSDDEVSASSVIKPAGKTPAQKTPVPSSPTHSFLETMSIDERVDDDRRRRRERLAKLHRFLGSRVPANLVLGIDDVEGSLPPPLDKPLKKGSASESDDSARKVWLMRRRSSSAAAPSSSWPDELDRVKEELDDKEKAINVRRAQKMEKVFGVAPPLTLYHTRHCPSPTSLPPGKTLPPLPVVSPIQLPELPTLSLSVQRNGNPNRSSYIKPKMKKNSRPGTAESSKGLLPKGFENQGFDFDDRPMNQDAQHSLIYNHYQHSLNSLNDIIDRDDRESLAELHQYLNSADVLIPTAPLPELEDFTTSTRTDRRSSISSTVKSERRRSLPARTSMISLAGSEFTIPSAISTPKAEITTFQVRRRRAAKLTHFFGVNYRELINDVLESIENGVEHEQMRGTLQAEEVEDLLSKLRNLKTKRQGVF